MEESAAAELVELAHSDPARAFEQADRALQDGNLDDAVASVLLRAQGEAARWVRDSSITESVALLEQAVARADFAGRDDLVREAQLTLAGSQYLKGDTEPALRTLDRAARGSDGRLAAKILFQRATILAREGQPDEALIAFDRALEQFEAFGDLRFAALTLSNRGMVLLERGLSQAATEDFEAAQHQFRRLGLHADVAWTEHNLGRAAGLRGDIITALRRFNESESELDRLGENTAEVQVNRCEVLLQAGLYEEAESAAEVAEMAMLEAQLALERAEAVLARSLALLGQGRFAGAADHAARAARLFREQRRVAWSLQAMLVEIRSEQAAGAPARIEHATTIACELSAKGQRLAAAQAWAVVARANPARAVEGLQSLNLPEGGVPLEFRLTKLEILGLHRLAHFDLPGALAALDGAMELGRRHQLSLGASDIRAAMSAQLDSLAQLGLRVHRSRRDPWSVIRWVDRSRNASLHAHVHSIDTSAEIGDLIAQLRAVHVATRGPVSGGDFEALVQRQASLQRQLADAQRLQSSFAHPPPSQLLATDIRARCGGVTVIQHHRIGPTLGATVVDQAGGRIIDLAPLDEVNAAQASLRHALVRLIANNTGALAAVERSIAKISLLLVPEMRDDNEDSQRNPTVIVPLPQHHGIPWSLMPALCGGPVTVAPSLAYWLGTQPVLTTSAAKSVVGLIEGQGLRTGGREIRGIRRMWDRTETLRAADVGITLDLLRRVDVAHLACHGLRRHGDGRFAQLRLRDGDLTAFDLEVLERTPPLVVLSACEAGLVDALPGEESAGLTTSLFARGTETIIASTVLLPDDASTASLFIDLHAELARGVRPALALFAVQQRLTDPKMRVIARSINCLGRG